MAWSNNLQLFPTLQAFLGLWSAGLLLQLGAWVCVFWVPRLWKQVTRHAERRNSDLPSLEALEQAYEEHATMKASPESCWRRLETALLRLARPSKSSGKTSVTARLANVAATYRSGRHRPLPWKQMALRSLALTVVIALVQSIVGSIVLYLRTGSMVEQPYEWYSLQNTGQRLYKDLVQLQKGAPSTCAFTSYNQTVMKTLDQIKPIESAPRTTVYVVACNEYAVLELSLDQVQPTRDTMDAYEHATLVDNLTMFPYLWLSILGPHFDARVNANASPWSRTIKGLNLEYRIIRSQGQLDMLPANSNLLVVAQSTTSLSRFISSKAALQDARVGFLLLAREDCNNPHAKRLVQSKQIKFGFMPYGDCSLVDGERITMLPLGPSFEHGFPINAHKTHIPTTSERKYLLNLMVSWTIAKPTRVQAMMTALQVCRGKACIVEHNDMLFKTLEFMDQHLGTDMRWSLSSAPSVYIETLKRSVFTLCPFGRNPEQYRIWEALAAGSIPIIEDLPAQSMPGSFYHPSYPQSWKCMPGDIHGVLKKLGAPVLFVTDWQRDLPRLLERYASDDEAARARLSELQTETRTWYERLGRHLQADVIEKSLRHFQLSS